MITRALSVLTQRTTDNFRVARNVEQDREKGTLAPRARHCQLAGFGQPRLSQPDTAKQILKARIITDGIEERMHFEPLQNAFLSLIRSLKPHERLVIVT